MDVCAAMQKELEPSEESDDLSDGSADAEPKGSLKTKGDAALSDVSKKHVKRWSKVKCVWHWLCGFISVFY